MAEPVKTYSAGMRARLGFSVAMYMTPDVLLLDEVLSVGDAEFRQKAEKEMLKKINSNQTVVLVSHSEGQVNRICDRVVNLDRR
jgi:lipopolysaccharide transport system ATP-binding protein